MAASRHSIALVGDGATDLCARESGVFVIGFGGVIRREALVKGADVFIAGPDLTAVLGPLVDAKDGQPPDAP